MYPKHGHCPNNENNVPKENDHDQIDSTYIYIMTIAVADSVAVGLPILTAIVALSPVHFLESLIHIRRGLPSV